MKGIHFVKTGAAARALAFIMVLAGCPTEAHKVLDLTGSVSISGFAKVGGTLTANAVLNGSGTISYVWKRGDSSSEAGTAISGADGGAYEPVAADEGKYLTVTVTRRNYIGGIISAPTSAVAGSDAVEPAVSGVSVTPADAAAVTGGDTMTFTAAVSGAGLDADPAYRAVTWSIEEPGKKAGTAISPEGVLTVAGDERLTSLTVKAASAFDHTKSGTATVTVISGNPDAGLTVDQAAVYLATLDPNEPDGPYTIKLLPDSGTSASAINLGGLTAALRKTENAGEKKYLILDFSLCTGADTSITGSVSTPWSGISGLWYEDQDYSGYTGSIVSIVLPDTITGIGGYSFYRVFAGGGSGFEFKTVILPGGLKTLGESAFAYSGLREIIIPGSVTGIGHEAFNYCQYLLSVTFAEGSAIAAGDFGYYTFYGDLREKYLGDGGGAGTYTRSSGGNTWTKTAAGS